MVRGGFALVSAAELVDHDVDGQRVPVSVWDPDPDHVRFSLGLRAMRRVTGGNWRVASIWSPMAL